MPLAVPKAAGAPQACRCKHVFRVSHIGIQPGDLRRSLIIVNAAVSIGVCSCFVGGSPRRHMSDDLEFTHLCRILTY